MKTNSPDSFPPLGLVQPRRSLARILFTALVSLVVVLTGTCSAVAANSPPTAISINFAPLTGDPGITIGTFVVTDPDAGQTNTCALVAGPGDTNNASFQIITARPSNCNRRSPSNSRTTSSGCAPPTMASRRQVLSLR